MPCCFGGVADHWTSCRRDRRWVGGRGRRSPAAKVEQRPDLPQTGHSATAGSCRQVGKSRNRADGVVRENDGVLDATTAHGRPTPSTSSRPLWIAGALDLISVTPFGAYLGFLAAGVATRVAFRRRYSTAQRAVAWIALVLGLAFAVFWWWISSYAWI